MGKVFTDWRFIVTVWTLAALLHFYNEAHP